MKAPSNSSLVSTSYFLLFTFLFLLSYCMQAQGVGINNNGQSPYAGAILDIVSNDKGVLLPRTDTLGIVNPSEGMIIYDTLGNVFRYYSGQRWLMMLQEGYYQFWWADMDGDGYGYPFNVIYAPEPPQYYVGNNADCDDNNAQMHPSANEICDGMDNDCNGLVDDNIALPACYICSGANVLIDYDYCIIMGVCYPNGTISDFSPCMICDSYQNQDDWTSNCSGSEVCCGNICINILTDVSNCGGCGIVCDDGNPCTFDICSGGVCIHINISAGETCPDGLCDGNGSCIPNCEGGCDDGNPCTEDVCIGGECFHTNFPVGTACGSGNCDGNGVCIPNCEGGCDDGNPCTEDLCIGGECFHTYFPAGTACGGGNCDGTGVCIPNCEGGCDDGNPCTTDVCVAGVCQHTFKPAGTACPGGICNGVGSCIPQ